LVFVTSIERPAAVTTVSTAAELLDESVSLLLELTVASDVIVPPARVVTVTSTDALAPDGSMPMLHETSRPAIEHVPALAVAVSPA